MCGIFGIISDREVNKEHLRILALHSRRRGRDTSGLVYYENNGYKIVRADYDIMQLLNKVNWSGSNVVMGHSRLITNGLLDNQPVVRDGIFVIHNGIIVNEQKIWESLNLQRHFQIDSEAIIAIAIKYLDEGRELMELPEKILSICEGIVAAALAIPGLGKMLLFSNNGSLYLGKHNSDIYFASERYPLEKIACDDIKQIWRDGLLIDIPKTETIAICDDRQRKVNLIPKLKYNAAEEAMLQYPQPELKRCTKCILPETMPFIEFDEDGVCNYCHNYKPRNTPKPKEELFELVEPYRRKNKPDCIVPFSGGRDSSYGLHLIVNELKMTPITYTYDWGMVTDLGRRNISRMCAKLGVENIVVAANISKKRQNIVKNLKAWLKSPHLGMISILTAGDKHFFQHVETIKKETGISLNLWSTNPLEVTHFKAGFLGVKPDFEGKKVYMTGVYNQLIYQILRFKAMLQSPGYFNSSLWDTLSGEYYRSFAKKKDYYHIYDYWYWDEKVINETLKQYDWEVAPDTNATWRIGDGTAAFYNYIYYTVAGFTEHDTFRSNQIREGQITREEALKLVKDENRPRYQNIRWYLDTLNMDFLAVIKVINSIPKLYSMD
ncbi:MAG: glucosamine 6-phosphate synthetase [Syntrophomonadaceae bacterium]|nr:glucosamine 6-phosphate synthetase [Syntrophomonadaceae bacterium]